MTESPAIDPSPDQSTWPERWGGRFKKWVAGIYADLQAPPKGRRIHVGWMIVLPLALLVALTVMVRLTDFDLGVQRVLYKAGQNSWVFGEHTFWRALYEHGPIILTLVTCLSILGFFLGWKMPVLRQWRRVFIFNLILALLGPGVIVNGLLKEHWGRPRPREVMELGGHRKFEPILMLQSKSEGKSFPSGHATVGFYFFGFFFLLRRHRPELAEFFFLFALTLGSLLGIARMAQGGHFFSDVVWAGAICYFTALILYYGLRLDKGLIRTGVSSIDRVPLWIRISCLVLGIGVLTAALLATPYREKRELFPIQPYSLTQPISLRLHFQVGEIDLVPGEQFHLSGEAYGHGVPTSKVAYFFDETEHQGTAIISYSERMSGWLAEANQQLTLEIPWRRVDQLYVSVENRADVWIDLPDTGKTTHIFLANGDGEVHLRLKGGSVHIASRRGEEGYPGENLLSETSEENADYILHVADRFQGTVAFKQAED